MSYSYSLSGVTVYQGFPYPGMSGLADDQYIRVLNIGNQLTGAHTGDSCYWDVFNAPRMFGHLAELRYAGTVGVAVNLPGPMDLPPGAYLGWTYNGGDANTRASAWVVYEIRKIQPGQLGPVVQASPASCNTIEKLIGAC